MWSRAARSYVAKTLSMTLKTAGITGYVYCLYYTVTHHIITFVVLEGDSMKPTINDSLSKSRDIVLVEFWTTKRQRLKINDIVIAKQPDQPSTLICKRISALEGERIPPGAINPCGKQTVPRGQVWLQGDNLTASYDSRHFGPLPYALILGKVFFRIWPFSRFGGIT